MWDNNPYYNPENLGLTMVGEYELSEPSWSFDTIIVLEDKYGSLYAAHDSGCSCPTPFENHKFPEDFTLIDSVQTLEALTDNCSYSDGVYERSVYTDVKNKVREKLRDKS